MTADIESAALAIHAQRRRSFTCGRPPHVVPITIVGPGGSSWEIRFSVYMPAENIADIVTKIVNAAERENASSEVVAFSLAYIQALSDDESLSHGDAA